MTTKTTVLGSAPTRAEIENVIAAFYGGERKTLREEPDGSFSVFSGERKLSTRVVQKRGRFIFEATT